MVDAAKRLPLFAVIAGKQFVIPVAGNITAMKVEKGRMRSWI